MSVHENCVLRNLLLEKAFKETYKVDAEISVVSYHDAEWNWDKVVTKFVDNLGKTYGLIEHFPPGRNNSTDFVIFEYEDKQGIMHQERFDLSNSRRGEIYLTAELALVELMIRRQRGEDL